MFYHKTGATILTAVVALAGLASAESKCSASNNVINGIPYCNEVDHIRYKNVASPGGSYEGVTKMDPETCTCEKTKSQFSGTIAPLDEDMSLHFRGPMSLKQVAVYFPGGSQRREVVPPYGSGRGNTAPANKTLSVDEEPGLLKRSPWGVQRAAYYNAEQGTSEGLIFMNNHGGDGSGVFDNCWGASLSFCGSDATGGASEPTVLKDTLIPSNTEFSIFSDEECDDSCGYTRPGIPAYKGFAGKNKVFLFEFSMPNDSAGGFNSNMPSIWGLNAKIPRASQYSDCSCWGSGCGEFDFLEVLEGHKDRLKTHFHADPKTNAGGGSPDFFARPTSKHIKAAAVFDATGEVHVKILKDDVQFGSSLPAGVLDTGSDQAAVYELPIRS